MAERKASVRLDLKSDGFRRGFTTATNEVKRGASEMGSTLRTQMSAAAKSGTDAVRGMLSTIKTGFMSLGGIIGGIGFAGLVKGAVESETRFRKLSFTMGAGTGRFEHFSKLQEHAQASAFKWGQNTEQLAEAMDTVFNTVGDAQYTKTTLDEIAKAARASGQEVSTISPIVAEMNRQFGVTADEVPEALARVMSLTARGALSTQELGQHMGKMGKLAREAGLQGVDGMARMIALVNEATEEGGNAGATVEKINQVFSKLSSSAQQVKKELKVDIEGLDSIRALQAVLQAADGDTTQLNKVFGKELGVFVKAAFGGIQDLDAAMAEAAKGALSASEVQAKAKDNMQSAEAGIAVAMETLKQAFTKPEMLSAVESLAANLPTLAEAVAKAIEFVTKNPALSAGVLLGGTFIKGAIGPAITAAFSSGGAGAAASMSTAMATGGAAAAASMSAAMLAAGAGAAALIGVAAAIDQGIKLKGDIEQHEQDVANERENLLGAAEGMGETYAVRERPFVERFTAGRGLDDFIDLFAGVGKQELLTRDKEGKLVAKRHSEEEQEQVSVPFRMRGGDDVYNDPNFVPVQRYEPRMEYPAIPIPTPQQAAPKTDPGAVAAALAARQLDTKISNANAVTQPIVAAIEASARSGGKKTGTGPTPGTGERN